MAIGPMSDIALGIDVGGTGVKGALVDSETGDLVSSRVRLKTPTPATPAAVVATIGRVVERIAAERPLPVALPVGCGLPGPIKNGRLLLAANIDRSWIDVPAAEVIGEALGRTVLVINDADAAGVAEMRYGAGRGELGTVLLLTIGTGIGSGLFHAGRLVPNTEFGHLEVNGKDIETMVGGAARESRRLKWRAWANEFNVYLARLEMYLWPDLIILGGGVSKSMEKFASLLESRAPVVQAQFLNSAGIIGAAISAAEAAARDGS